jgi:hypothetical protein
MDAPDWLDFGKSNACYDYYEQSKTPERVPNATEEML